MNYALIENGLVVNIIWMYEGNETEFPDTIPTNGLPVQIGDTYANGQFLRNGEPVRTPQDELTEALALLGVTDDE